MNLSQLKQQLQAAKKHGDECSAALEKAHVRIKELTQENSALMEGCKRLADSRAAIAPDVGRSLSEELRLLREVEAAAATLKSHLKVCARYGYTDGVAIDRRLCTCPRDRIRDALARLAAYRSSQT